MEAWKVPKAICEIIEVRAASAVKKLWHPRTLDVEDLVQEGMLWYGMIRGHFDPSRGIDEAVWFGSCIWRHFAGLIVAHNKHIKPSVSVDEVEDGIEGCRLVLPNRSEEIPFPRLLSQAARTFLELLFDPPTNLKAKLRSLSARDSGRDVIFDAMDLPYRERCEVVGEIKGGLRGLLCAPGRVV